MNCHACDTLKSAAPGKASIQCYCCRRALLYEYKKFHLKRNQLMVCETCLKSNCTCNQAKTVHPSDQGKRDIKRPRHDLIPVEFLDELASIFEEGLPKYGDSWKKGGKDFLTDCLNHASNHLHLYMNGDTSENQLAKVAWNALVVRWHDLKEKKKE